MRFETIARWSAIVLIVVMALVIQSVAFDRRLESTRADLRRELTRDMKEMSDRLESAIRQLQKPAVPSADHAAASPAPVAEKVAQSVEGLEKRMEKLEQASTAEGPAKPQELPIPMFTADLKATLQLKEAIRPAVQEIMKEEEEKSWQARREGMRVNYETAIRKELNTLGVTGPVQDQLVKMYQEESTQWAGIWWGEYQSKLRDGSFKDLTQEERLKKRAEIDERLRQLEASYDAKKKTMLSVPQYDKMKEFEKKYWNRN